MDLYRVRLKAWSRRWHETSRFQAYGAPWRAVTACFKHPNPCWSISGTSINSLQRPAPKAAPPATCTSTWPLIESTCDRNQFGVAMHLIQRQIQGKSLPKGYSDDLIRMYNQLVQSRGGSVTHPSTPWQEAVFTVVVLRVSTTVAGGRLCAGFPNAKIPLST